MTNAYRIGRITRALPYPHAVNPARRLHVRRHVHSQNLIRQGFAQIDARRWQNVHAIAEQLLAYSGNCNSDFKIQNPTTIYGLYFAGYSLHELGDDPHAEEAVAAGLRSLEQLKKQGGYTSLYDNVRPLFVDVQSRIAGGYQ